MSASRVNINSADLESLARLPGIGETLAERIIAYREQRRPFVDIVELAEVEGISIHMVNDIADRITAGRDAAPAEGAPAEGAPSQGAAGTSPPVPSDSTGDGQSVNGHSAQPAAAVLPVDEAQEQPPLVLALPEVEPPEPRPATVSDTPPVASTRPAPPASTRPAARAATATTTRPTPARPPAAAPSESRPARQPVLFWGYLLSAAAGALMGAVLALFFLLTVNGTLTFADRGAVTSSQQRTTVELQAIAAEQEGMATRLSEMTDQVEIARSQAATLTLQLATVSAQQSAQEGDVEGVDEAVATLSVETERFTEELDALSVAAAGFERFLDGMRALLGSLDGTPPAATVTATPSPATTNTPESAGSATPATSTAMPTRTPRPSATPFSP